jgi:hypothetical protein
MARTQIIAEKFTNGLGQTRYRFVVMSLKVGQLSGHPGVSRSLRCWATKRAAIEAGRREFCA